MEAKASEPAPQKQSLRNSRRLRAYRMCWDISVHVKKGVQVEDGQGKFLHLGGDGGGAGGGIGGSGVADEFHRQRLFAGRGQAAGGQPPCVIDTRRRRVALLQNA